MVRPSTAPQAAFDLDVTRRVGRVEAAYVAAVEAARADGTIGVLDAGLAGLAIELARAVDVASWKSDPYGVAQAGKELREVSNRLKLDPTARGTGTGDAARELIASLGIPSRGDVRDAADT
jgi:hypothetical protein